jgi:hypothetical protein
MGDSLTVLVWFNLDHEGKRYLIEGSFLFTSHDDPGLHWHSWHDFIGLAVSSR